LEQLFIAALDTKKSLLAETFLNQMSQKFTNSGRVLMLQGMYHESLGDYPLADSFYEKALERDETNSLAAKRQISLLLAQNKIKEAVASLKQYLEVFMQDLEAWSQLSQLYIQLHMYQQAAFCLEELLLQKPHAPFYQIRYADLQMSLGDWPLAIKYYSSTLVHCEDQLRAVYGLYTACQSLLINIKENKPVQSKWVISQDIAEDLLDLSKERIACIYKGDNQFRDRGLEKIITSWLERSSNLA
jgi:tetratricopeptide (TPR) repeat protein